MRRRQTIEYVALLAAAFVIALVASLTPLGTQLDEDAYDAIFRLYRPPDWQTQSVVLAIDEESFQASGEVRGLRGAMAQGLELIAKASPKAVAIDMILAERDPSDDRLE